MLDGDELGYLRRIAVHLVIHALFSHVENRPLCNAQVA